MADNPFQRFYSELKRRKVFRVAVVYGLVAWAFQITSAGIVEGDG